MATVPMEVMTTGRTAQKVPAPEYTRGIWSGMVHANVNVPIYFSRFQIRLTVPGYVTLTVHLFYMGVILWTSVKLPLIYTVLRKKRMGAII